MYSCLNFFTVPILSPKACSGRRGKKVSQYGTSICLSMHKMQTDIGHTCCSKTHMQCYTRNYLNVTCRKIIFLNSSPEQSWQKKCFLCLLCLSQQIKHEQCDFSNFSSTIENYAPLCLCVCFCSACLCVWKTLIVCVCVGCATCISCTQVQGTLSVAEQWVQQTEDWGADLVNNPDKQTRRWAAAVKQWQHNRPCFISGRQRR